MSVSNKTANEIAEKIITWAEMYNVPMFAVINLLEKIGDVPGNKSFKDTMIKLKELLKP